MKKILLFAVLAFFVTSSTQAVPLANGGFESGDFTSWSTIGTNQVTGAFSGSGPAEGSFQAVIQTPDNGTVNQASLETFLALQAGSLSGLNSSQGLMSQAGGSAIKQTPITITAGQMISFQWDFLPGGTTTAPAQNDRAFFTFHLDSVTGTGTNVIELASTFLPGGGYATFITDPLPAGDYLLGFGVFDNFSLATNLFRPDLLIDNVRVIPEPGTLSLLAVGLFLGGAYLCRRRNS